MGLGGGHSLGAEAHAETGQVSVGEGEDGHEDDVPGVVGEKHGEGVARLHVAQHEERDEDEPQAHQDRKPDAVLARLQGKPQTSTAQPSAAFRLTGGKTDVCRQTAAVITLRSRAPSLDHQTLPQSCVRGHAKHS